MIPRLNINFNREQRHWFIHASDYVLPNNQFWLNHCRSGIILSLLALELPPKAKVGVMVYNCHSVMNSVWQAGCEVVFIDVDDKFMIDNLDLDSKIQGLSVLIVSHLFGVENDIHSIKQRYPNLLIIEDCAHLYGKKIDGDFGIYSIGQGKFPSIGDGGILIVNNSRYLGKIQQIYSKYNNYSKLDEILLFTKLFIKSILYLPIVYKRITLPLKSRQSKTLQLKPTDVKKMSKGVAAIYKNEIIDYEDKIKMRFIRAKYLIEKYDIKNYVIGKNAFMLIAYSVSPLSLKKALYTDDIDSDVHFKHCINWAKSYGYKMGSCPKAEQLTKQILMIPIYK